MAKIYPLIAALCIFFILFIEGVVASPFIIGFVNDSYDGENANGHVIVLWNPSNGIIDNVTDIIGQEGNSGADNFYMIDCNALATPCDVGDTLSLKVINQGDDYITRTIDVYVTGAGYELAQNLRINSKPNVGIISPLNNSNLSGQIAFNCSAFDYDGDLANISLYSNFSGIWKLNETKQVTGTSNSTIFYKNLSDGRYLWGCDVSDNLSIINHSLNYSLTSDNTPPSIGNISINESRACLNNVIRVSCNNVTDALLNVDNVLIEAVSNVSSINYTVSSAGINNHYLDIVLNQFGRWGFRCIVNDSLNNIGFSNFSNSTVLETMSNLKINSSSIIFDNNNPIEDEDIWINVSVENDGCADASDVLIGIYAGDPFAGGLQISNNLTGNISLKNSKVFSVLWQSKIGYTNIYSLLDLDNLISELNESDNMANRSINVVSWHLFYGNITADRILGSDNMDNMSLWLNHTNFSGNVYAADTESDINWASLMALGINVTGGSANDDFAQIDYALGSSNYFDSVSNVYTIDGYTPRDESQFIINKRSIGNVPVVNTSASGNFLTGILWDSSDDSDGSYGGAENEDLIFISEIKKGSLGALGYYDYELNVPSRLRSYNPTDDREVYLYFDIN